MRRFLRRDEKKPWLHTLRASRNAPDKKLATILDADVAGLRRGTHPSGREIEQFTAGRSQIPSTDGDQELREATRNLGKFLI